jgi:hypothetical protein
MKPLALAMLVLAGLTFSPLWADDGSNLTQILDRAGIYVARFQTEFASFVSDEAYSQKLWGQLYSSERSRKTRSEMVFTWLPDQRSWLTVRNVLTVDGRPIADGQDALGKVLADPSSRLPSLRALRERGASFNLGNIRRTTNDPNLVLLFLDRPSQHRFNFTLNGRERVNGTPAWKISYDEHVRPTIIQEGNTGADLFSRGTIWVSESTAAVVRTDVSVYVPRPDTYASVTVDYKFDPKFDIWLPARMRESYAMWLVIRGSYAMGENIECEATYSNFRRFETTARILAQ